MILRRAIVILRFFILLQPQVKLMEGYQSFIKQTQERRSKTIRYLQTYAKK